MDKAHAKAWRNVRARKARVHEKAEADCASDSTAFKVAEYVL
jgi:hypothetical protein